MKPFRINKMTSNINTLRTHFQSLIDDNPMTLRTEYQMLKDQGPCGRTYLQSEFSECQKMINDNRNRYTDVYCIDKGRVKLEIEGNRHSSTSSDSEKSNETLNVKNQINKVLRNMGIFNSTREITINSDYIHANYVNGYNSSRLESKKCYIAAQGPMKETAGHFWEMIVQNNISTIIMTTKFVENRRDKCFEYFPTIEKATKKFSGNDLVNHKNTIEVKCVRKPSLYSSYNVSELEVIETRPNKNGEKEVRTLHVNHCWYTAWPDHGAPETSSEMIQFIQHVRSIDQKTVQSRNKKSIEKHDYPVLIHCSAGIGRTGTYMVIDQIMHLVDLCKSGKGKELDKDVVFNTCLEIRKQRCMAIQTDKQYRFCYKAVADYINMVYDQNADENETVLRQESL